VSRRVDEPDEGGEEENERGGGERRRNRADERHEESDGFSDGAFDGKQLRGREAKGKGLDRRSAPYGQQDRVCEQYRTGRVNNTNTGCASNTG
jgi:hypothetical protein